MTFIKDNFPHKTRSAIDRIIKLFKVAVARLPSNDVPWASARDVDGGLSPYIWLGPINAMRMSAIIAVDLARLSPSDAHRITRNLAALEARLRQLKVDYSARMLAVLDLRVLSLADEFIYLFDEFGIFVDEIGRAHV